MGQSAKFSHHEHWHNAKSNSEALVPIRKTDQSIVQYRANVAHPHTVGIGTASYASPEQVKSRNYGVTADMFSLGLILLELVSCFETEHERLHNFQECRNQRLARWIQENYPEIGSMILACTRDDPDQRPSAKSLLEEVSRILSPTPYKEAHILQRQLAEKEEQLKEKDKIIENLRLEMKKMKAHLLITNGSSDQALRKLEPESECVTVEECTSFQNDES